MEAGLYERASYDSDSYELVLDPQAEEHIGLEKVTQLVVLEVAERVLSRVKGASRFVFRCSGDLSVMARGVKENDMGIGVHEVGGFLSCTVPLNSPGTDF